MALAMTARVEGRPMTAAERRMEERCAAWQQRVMAKESAAGGLRSLFSAQALLERWGRERLAGLGCDCPSFRPAPEDQEQSCATRPASPCAICASIAGCLKVAGLLNTERPSLSSDWVRF